MSNYIKRFLSMAVALVMIIGMIPSTVFAAETPTTVSTEEALRDALTAGGSVTLGADIGVAAQIVIPVGVTATLDLNGYDINGGLGNGANHIYVLSNKGTLTITDSSNNLVEPGSINSRGIYNYGALTLESGKIAAIDGNGGYAVNNEPGATFVMNGGWLAADYEDGDAPGEGYDATALDVPSGCTATLNGGKITNAGNFTFAIAAAGTLNIPATSTITVKGRHGAINVSGGITTVDAGTFSIPENTETTDNVTYVAGGTLIINGGTFTGDSDGPNGGSCVCDETGGAVINGGTFGNSSGGDVWGTTGTTIKGGTFENLTETDHVTVGATIVNGGNTYTKTAEGMVEVTAVAKVGNDVYATLQAAVEAAATSGGTVTLLSDITLAVNETLTVTGPEAMTIDFAGYTINASFTSDTSIFLAVKGSGNLVLTDSSEAKSGGIKATGKVGEATTSSLDYLIGMAADSCLTINGGNYWQDASAVNGMIYANKAAEKKLTVNGGTFHLGNVGTGANGSPWIFNVSGSNESYIRVNGGTFNADVFNQYWRHEVQCDGLYTAINNNDGTWTVAPANAYVAVQHDGYDYYVGYATLQEAIDAAASGKTVTLLADITASETINVTKEIVLDLNGKTISGTHAAEYSMIHVQNGATLTVDGEGTITYAAGGNNIGAAIWVEGALVQNGGIIEVTGSWTLGFAVDLRPNAWGTAHTAPASFVMNDGTVKSTDTAVRVASNSSDSYEELGVSFTMNGGTIDSTWDAIFVQHLYNGDLDILVKGGTVSGDNSVLRVYGDAGSEIDMVVQGGNFTGAIKVADAYANADVIAISGGTFSNDVSAYCADGYMVKENDNGTYGVVVDPAYGKVAKIGTEYFETLSAALAAAQAGQTITFVADITENVTISKSVIIDGAGKTYTGAMTLKADTTIENVNFDGKGYNGYAIETRGANYVTIEDCTAQNYGYGFVQLASGTALTTVKNVTVSNMNYGVKIDYSNAVVIENAKIDAAVAAVLNSNYGEKTITIKNSELTILGTWTRNNTIKTNYVFEGENKIDSFVIDAAIDTFKLAVGATLTAPNAITATATEAGYTVKYEDGKYFVKANMVAIGEQTFATLAEAIAAAQAGDTVKVLSDIVLTETLVVAADDEIILDLNGKTVSQEKACTEGYSMIENNGKLTITGEGKLSFTDTGAGDSTFGWGSYTISNRGTLVVENGTIEHLGTQDFASHCIQAIFNYSGSTTINGGTISTPNYRSIRLWHGSVTINGGTIDGQVWLQSIDNANAALTITGGSFSPNGGDGSSVFVGNATNNVSLTVTGGTFETKIGCTDAAKLAGSITGGKFSASAKENTNAALLLDGAIFGALDSDGYYSVVAAVAAVNGVSYESLAEAIAAAQAGDTVTIFAGTYALPAMKAGITVVGEGEVLLEGTLSGTLENLTLKNLHIKGGNAQRWAYAKGNLVFENVTFEATSVYALHFDGITEGATLLYKDCTIIGWAAMSGSPESCVFDGCTIKGNGTYGLIRTYFDATIENCTFDVANVNTTDVYQDGIHAVGGATVTVNNCTNDNGEMKDLVNVNANSVVVLDGVKIQNVAKIGDTYYTTIDAALAAAQAGDTVTIFAGTYALPAMKAGITVVGEGEVLLEGTLSGTLENLTLKNLHIKGSNAQRWAYAKGNLVFENVTFEATGIYALHFDGITEGATLLYKNCTIIGWAAMSGSPESCVFDGCTIKGNGTYGLIRTYFDATIENCTFDVANVNTTDAYQDGIHAVGGATVTVNNCTNDNGAMKDLVNVNANSVVVLDGVKIQNVAKIGDVYYATLAEAIAAVGAGDVVIDLVADAAMDYTARDAFGTAETTSLTINGNGHTLTLNQTNSDWASFGLANADAKLVLNNMTIEKTGYGDTSGAWNTHTIIFTSEVEMTDVTVNNSICVEKDATLTNVTINEANGYYGLWITADGQTVTMNGGEIKATNGGRGIKIADQYVDAPASVELSVSGTKFTTAKKAAVLVSSTAGAEITAADVDITGVAEDTVNFVWVDEDWAAYHGQVTVTGATKGQEGIENFAAALVSNGAVKGYYTTLQAAIDAAKDGDIVTLLVDSAEDITVVQQADLDLVIDGNGKTYSGTITIHGQARYEGDETLVIQNFKFATTEASHYFIDSNSTASAERYAHNVTVQDCSFTATDAGVNSAAAMRIRQGFNIAVKNCEATDLHSLFQGYGVAGLSFEACKVTGKSGISIGTSTNVAISGCTMDVDGYGIRADGTNAGSALTVTNCTIEANDPIVVRKVTEAYTLTLTGTNTLNGTNAGDYEVIFTTGDDGTYEAPTVMANVTGAENMDVFPVYAAKIGNAGYETLAAAIAAVQNGDTITLLDACDENVTIKQTEGVSFTIDGGNNTFTGTITVDGNKRYTGTETLTIRNVNFVADTNGQYMLSTVKGSQAHNITVSGCTFTGDGDDFGIVLQNAVDITLTDITATGLADFVYGKFAVTNMTATNIEVTETGMAFFLTSAANVSFTGCDLQADYGIAIKNASASSATITGCTIKASNTPVYLWLNTANKDYALVFEGANALTAGAGLAPVYISAQQDADVSITLNGTGLDAADLNGVVANVDNVYYNKLVNAVAAAEAGDWIYLRANSAEDISIAAKQTLVVNGFAYTGTVTLTDVAAALTCDKKLTVASGVGGYEVTYTDGTYKLTEKAVEYELSIAGATMSLGNELAINFVVKKADVQAEDYYITVTKTYADGRENVVERYDFEDWIDYTSTYYAVKFNDISAKEMTDTIYVQIFHEDGTAASDVWVDSVRAYAMRAFANSNDINKTMFVDMLNYGAAAQEEFTYGLSDLANSKLTDEQKAYATQSVTYSDNREKGTNYYGSNLNLGSSIALNMFFTNITPDMYAIATFTDHYGNEETQRIEGSEFIYHSASGGYRVSVNTLAVADMRQMVTVNVYDAEGNVVAWGIDSVESYLARQASVSALYEAIMKFATSAYNSFHQ